MFQIIIFLTLDFGLGNRLFYQHFKRNIHFLQVTSVNLVKNGPFKSQTTVEVKTDQGCANNAQVCVKITSAPSSGKYVFFSGSPSTRINKFTFSFVVGSVFTHVCLLTNASLFLVGLLLPVHFIGFCLLHTIVITL